MMWVWWGTSSGSIAPAFAFMSCCAAKDILWARTCR
jgi:hypothetical protein